MLSERAIEGLTRSSASHVSLNTKRTFQKIRRKWWNVIFLEYWFSERNSALWLFGGCNSMAFSHGIQPNELSNTNKTTVFFYRKALSLYQQCAEDRMKLRRRVLFQVTYRKLANRYSKEELSHWLYQIQPTPALTDNIQIFEVSRLFLLQPNYSNSKWR